ncbi:hypothetical protein K458DRAFT_417957 [Lentithecium fluviatile CBS 122367]|uniref:Uncharacterized protein n=1 Tax=Lentithecium fluviatile CBS 122367 TaxID=1168545 RepID=A0A6G1J1I3_9PLEO|nr:hypothetical protein K458DRAFT_417957 [Lentithecium fluviatile CBS 122367]
MVRREGTQRQQRRDNFTSTQPSRLFPYPDMTKTLTVLRALMTAKSPIDPSHAIPSPFQSSTPERIRSSYTVPNGPNPS